jgi:hypothetical protein
MMEEYNLTLDQCNPDEIVVSDTDLNERIAFYYKFIKENDTNVSPNDDRQATVSRQPLFKRIMGRLLQIFSRKPKSQAVFDFVFRVPKGDQKQIHTNKQESTLEQFIEGIDFPELTPMECYDLASLLVEISKCPVPMDNELFGNKGNRHVFFQNVECMKGILTQQLQVIWPENGTVALFFTYGLVKSFYSWAEAFQPKLGEELKQYADDKIIVIVFSMRRMSPQLLTFLRNAQKSIWHI